MLPSLRDWLPEGDIAFKVITANQKPDHSSISRFRKENSKELEGLFVQILCLCSEAGLVKVGTVALDGTKIEANASLSANRTKEHIEKEVAKRLAEAEATDFNDGLFSHLFAMSSKFQALLPNLQYRSLIQQPLPNLTLSHD